MVRTSIAAATLLAAILWGAVLPPAAHAAGEPFPQFAAITPNVDFWTDIYTQYDTTQAVVHDSLRLDIVYDVIDLVPAGRAGSRKINRRRMKAVSRRYASLLKRLAADPDTADPECRRIASLFAPDANARAFDQARHRVRCQIGQRDRFRAGLIRSGAYLERMRAILRSQGVPEDLAYLPHVESSFDIGAYSKFGAAGMWQFTRSTGRRFLTVDHVLDERRDPIRATHAAACLLKENYEKLGSWPLAITAYNHGAAGMERAKAAHGDYPTIFSAYRGRTFKFASRNFYSEFLAARRIAADHQRYFGELSLEAPVRRSTVQLPGFAALDDLSRHFDVPGKTLIAMNPALQPSVISGQKYVPAGFVLNLPPTVPTADDGRLAGLPANLLQDRQKASRFYTVQRGDTAGKIARMHRVRLGDLILANNLNRRATVYLHQRLRIPQAADRLIVAAAPAAEPASTPSVETAAVAFAAPEDLPVEGPWGRYRRSDPAPAVFLDKAGAAVSVASAADPTAVTADLTVARIVRARRPVGVLRVEVEETIGHYAEWAGVSAARIRRINHLASSRSLHLRQKLMIPLDRVTAEQFENRRRTFHQQLQADFFAANRIDGVRHYRVQAGDTYWSLCREKFDLPLWLLRHYNADVNLAALKVHQPLIIPAVENLPVGRADDAGRHSPPDA